MAWLIFGQHHIQAGGPFALARGSGETVGAGRLLAVVVRAEPGKVVQRGLVSAGPAGYVVDFQQVVCGATGDVAHIPTSLQGRTLMCRDLTAQVDHAANVDRIADHVGDVSAGDLFFDGGKGHVSDALNPTSFTVFEASANQGCPVDVDDHFGLPSGGEPGDAGHVGLPGIIDYGCGCSRWLTGLGG